MIYETRNHWFIKENGKKIETTNLEHKLLMALSGETISTYKELAKSIYDTEINEYVKSSIRALKSRLQKKAKIIIRSLKNKGYILTTKIYFK